MPVRGDCDYRLPTWYLSNPFGNICWISQIDSRRMLLNLTRKADYAVRAVLDVAVHHPEVRNTRQISAGMDLPRNLMRQILASLVRHGLLDSTAGPAGGYTLARPPSEITLLEVVQVIEGPVAIDSCMLSGGACDWEQACPVHEIWVRARLGLEAGLATTFHHLSEIDTAIRAGTYRVPAETPPHPEIPPRLGRED